MNDKHTILSELELAGRNEYTRDRARQLASLLNKLGVNAGVRIIKDASGTVQFKLEEL